MDIIDKYEEIYDMEREVWRDYIKAFEDWKLFIIRNNMAEEITDAINSSHYHMGSMADGASSARLFSESELMFEADFMVEICELPEIAVSRVPNKPGFYTVRNDGQFMDYLTGIVQVFRNDPRTALGFIALQSGMMTHGMLLGTAIKQLVSDIAGLEDGKKDVISVLAKACTVAPERVQCDMKTEFNGPATTQDIRVCVDGVHQVTLSFDMVVCARLSFWPPEASAWETRTRRWPPPAVIAEIIRDHQVHLVSKPSVELGRDVSDDWRLTFLAEKRLVEEHTPVMRTTYFLFKVLFYKYFKQEVVDKKTFPSYIAKTTMHWVSEESNPEIWTREKIPENVRLLLKRMNDFLMQDFVPNYFIPEINLLQSIPNRLVENAKNIYLNSVTLREDPISCLPTQFDKVKGHFRFLQKLSGECSTHYAALAAKLSLMRRAVFIDDDLD